jgi:tRNA1Val (adenine37-N6)-methyltransferase
MTYFRFKDFTVENGNAGCKVGTDGVLLGAWACVAGAETILDAGAGTGLIALMTARRNPHAAIDAVEIDEQTAEQARRNVLASRWNERISVVCSDFVSFASKAVRRYDAIVSNPPFFRNSLKSPDSLRNKARHSDSLPHAELVKHAERILSDKGRLSVILPFDLLEYFVCETDKAGLFLCRRLDIAPYPEKDCNRVLLEFSRKEGVIEADSLYIRESKAGDFSSEYRSLTADFYLNF